MAESMENIQGIEEAYLRTVRNVASQLRDSGPRTKLKVAREMLEMSQQEFADHFGISLSTLRNWESDSRPQPTGAAALFIDLLATDARVVKEMVGKSKRGKTMLETNSSENTNSSAATESIKSSTMEDV